MGFAGRLFCGGFYLCLMCWFELGWLLGYLWFDVMQASWFVRCWDVLLVLRCFARDVVVVIAFELSPGWVGLWWGVAVLLTCYSLFCCFIICLAFR